MIKRWCLGALLDEVEFLKVILMLGFADFLLIFDFAYGKIEACQKSLSLIIFVGKFSKEFYFSIRTLFVNFYF